MSAVEIRAAAMAGRMAERLAERMGGSPVPTRAEIVEELERIADLLQVSPRPSVTWRLEDRPELILSVETASLLDEDAIRVVQMIELAAKASGVALEREVQP